MKQKENSKVWMTAVENTRVILRHFEKENLYTIIFRRGDTYATVPFDITEEELRALLDVVLIETR